MGFTLGRGEEGEAQNIFHCWQKTGILSRIERSTVGRYYEYLQSLQEVPRIPISSLLNSNVTPTEIEGITEEYLHHDGDTLYQHAEPGIIPMSKHVSECIAGMENDLESLLASTPPPLISGSTAVTALLDLTVRITFTHFQLLLFHQYPSLLLLHNIPDSAKSLSCTHRNLFFQSIA